MTDRAAQIIAAARRARPPLASLPPGLAPPDEAGDAVVMDLSGLGEVAARFD